MIDNVQLKGQFLWDDAEIRVPILIGKWRHTVRLDLKDVLRRTQAKRKGAEDAGRESTA